MNRPTRFIGVAICCWAGVRAVSLGMIPGMSILAFDLESAHRRPSRLPPIQASALPPIEPVRRQPEYAFQSVAYGPASGFAAYPVFQPYPVYVPVPAGSPTQSAAPQIIYVNPAQSGPGGIHFHAAAVPVSPVDQQLAVAAPVPARQTTPSFEATKLPRRFDRLSLSSWALMRDKTGPDSFTGGGMLGGSEAGARLMWKFDPRIAATLRTSAPINSQRGMEAGLGVRYEPSATWPVAFTLERRHGFKNYGRNGFALFAEAGLYGQPMPWRSTLDGYFQAGVVDFNNPDWFVDGQLAMSRPVWRNVSAGFGVWGGAQPELNRLDVGPRLSINFGKGTRAHVDYRLNVAGNAQPDSGATVTLGGDF